MPKIEKMFEKVVRSPNNTNWRELVTLIEYYGCKVKQGSKHVLVYHDLRPRPITVSVHKSIDTEIKILLNQWLNRCHILVS